jgi:hypothetical protein
VDRNSKNGRTNVIDAERLGWPSTSNTDEKQEAKVSTIAQKITTEEIELHLCVSQGTAYSLVLDIFVLCKVYVMWVFKTSD